MYKVKYKNNGSFTSSGKIFYFDQWVNVTKEIFDYLKKNFKKHFEFEEMKEKVIEEKPTRKKVSRKKVTKEAE